jgi:hypothetical protein
VAAATDDNEQTARKSDGKAETAWIEFQLARFVLQNPRCAMPPMSLTTGPQEQMFFWSVKLLSREIRS